MALQDTDNLIIGRGTESYKITYQDLKDDLNYVPPPVGTIDKPTVLEPNAGAGGGDTRYLKSDAITDVESGGVDTCETKLIQTVESAGAPLVWEEGDGKVSFTDVDLTTWLASNNITSIKGFRMELFESTRGSEIRSFKINGTDLYGSGLAVASKSGSWYSTATPENWLNGIGAAVQNENGESQFTFAEQAITGTVTVTVTDANGDIYLIAGDDKEYSLMGGAAVKLTFPDTTGFDCFEPGDVVQGIEGVEPGDTYELLHNAGGGATPIAFDSITSGETTLEFGVRPSTSIGNKAQLYYDTKKRLTDVEFVRYAGETTLAAEVFLFGTNDVTSASSWVLLHSSININGPSADTYAKFISGKTPYQYFCLCSTANLNPNNYGITDTIFDSQVHIIDINDEAVPPTIAVDGGDWYTGAATENGGWTAGSTFASGYGPLKAFDGNYAVSTDTTVPFTADRTCTWQGNITIPNNATVEMVYWMQKTGFDTGSYIQINNTNIANLSNVGTSGTTLLTIDITNEAGSAINQMEIYRSITSGGGVGIAAILINGTAVTGSQYTDGALLGDNKLVKETPYDTKLTVASDKDLADMTGSVFGCSDAYGDGPFTQTPYLLQTTDIESVESVSTWNQDQNWSAAVTHSNLDPGLPFARGFDGNPETATGALRYNTLTLNFGNSFNVNPVKLEVVTADGRTVYVDGDKKGSADSSDTPSTVNCGTVAFSEIEISTDPVNSNGGAFWSIKINNQELVDQNVTGAPTIPKLVFPGDVSTNPDLQYFKAGDMVQEYESTTILTYKGYAQNDSDENLAISSLNYVGEETFGVKPTSGPGGQTQLAYEFTKPLENVDIGHFSTNSPVLDLYGSDTGLVNSWTFILNIDNRTQSALSGDRPYKYLKIVRRDAPGSVDYRNYGILESYVPVIKARVISTGYPDSNTMTVDGGEWSAVTAQTWSNDLSNSTLQTAAASFDGNLNTGAGTSNASSNPMVYAIPAELQSKDLVVYVAGGNTTPSQGQIEFDSNGANPISTGTAFNTTIDSANLNGFYLDVPSGTAQIKFSTTFNTRGCHFLGLEAGGTLLIDDTTNGDNHVEYQTDGGEGDIIKVNTDDNTILLSDTGDRDNRWIKGFSVAGPTVIDEPLLTNDVELRVSDFATTPPGADTLKEIIWSINGTEYSANTTNPWSPLEKLPINSSVTVKVKYKGNTLEDSEWSPDVTFTTGASMRSLFTRIAALEANDVTDDATDTALITLIAGLAARIQALEEAN